MGKPLLEYVPDFWLGRANTFKSDEYRLKG